jgi:hypothetical protein
MVISANFVAPSACVLEHMGPFESMDRSADLTRGTRWRIFGYYLLTTILGAAVGQAIMLLLRSVGDLPVAMIGLFIGWALVGGFSAVAAVTAYYDLRAAKGDVDLDRIAAVFD